MIDTVRAIKADSPMHQAKKYPLYFFMLIMGSFLMSPSQAGSLQSSSNPHPLYIGLMGGYGSTTWDGLVPTEKNLNEAVTLSTPIYVEEGGGVWGGFIGYEFTPYFALDLSYTHFENASITFDPFSLYAFTNHGLTTFVSKTEMVALMAKLMLLIPNTKVRLYSGLGIADVHRKDIILDQWRLAPTFGAGLNYLISPHLMAELGANYTAGYGESQLNPANTYMPFLYSIGFKLAYRF